MPSQRVYEHVRVSLRTDGQVALERKRSAVLMPEQ
jgi:hypothetical protein